ncbi:helix-turn-helix transcriptional regulator, partial [Myxococcota bacterium]|nr:helix-turn-helix transcriptional regulator [Myxococcota bacterium]
KDTIAARRELFQAMENGDVELREAIRRARRIMGLSQKRYAKLTRVAPRVLSDFERGVGNPTLQTLMQLAKPFGFRLVFMPSKHTPTEGTP